MTGPLRQLAVAFAVTTDLGFDAAGTYPAAAGAVPSVPVIVTVTTSQVTGTADPGATVTATDNGVPVGSVQAGAGGNFTIPIAAQPGDTIGVIATNPAGSTAPVTVSIPIPGPTIASVSPTTGPAGGRTTVTLTGAHFGSDDTVTVGGVPASLLSANATSLVVVTGAGTVGAADVTVRSGSGQSATLSGGFTYIEACYGVCFGGEISGPASITPEASQAAPAQFGAYAGQLVYAPSPFEWNDRAFVYPNVHAVTVGYYEKLTDVGGGDPIGTTYALNLSYPPPPMPVTVTSPDVFVTYPWDPGNNRDLYELHLTIGGVDTILCIVWYVIPPASTGLPLDQPDIEPDDENPYPGSVTVTMSPGVSGLPLIRFTLDGTAPTSNSAVYTGAFTLTTTTTVTAIAQAAGYTDSAPIARSYTIVPFFIFTINNRDPSPNTPPTALDDTRLHQESPQSGVYSLGYADLWIVLNGPRFDQASYVHLTQSSDASAPQELSCPIYSKPAPNMLVIDYQAFLAGCNAQWGPGASSSPFMNTGPWNLDVTIGDGGTITSDYPIQEPSV